MRGLDGDVGDVLAEAERAVQLAQAVRERLGDLVVHEVEEARPLVDDRDLDAEGREHRGVLDADDAGADDDERTSGASSRARMPSESIIVSPSTATPGGGAGFVPVAITILSASTSVVALPARHGQRVRRRERRGPGDERDPVPLHLGADDLDLALDDLVAAEEEVLHRDVVLHGVGRAVIPSLRDAR